MKAEIKIRVMTTADISGAVRLWLDTPGMGLSDEDDSPEALARFVERNPATCFVAEEDGVMLGCVLCGHDGRRATIYHLAVRPAARRRGIGKALVEACLAAMAGEGIIKARLLVFGANEDGNAFWESVGFTTRPDIVYRNKSVPCGDC